MGELRFHRDGIEQGTGAQRQWEIRRASIDHMELRDARVAEDPLRQVFWCLAYLGLGGSALWRGGSPWALVLRHLFRKATFLIVRTDRATGPIALGRRLTDEEKASLRRGLRALDFPI